MCTIKTKDGPPSRFYFSQLSSTKPTKDTSAEIWAHEKANGYKPGALKAEDSLKDLDKYVDKIKKDQDQILKLYVM